MRRPSGSRCNSRYWTYGYGAKPFRVFAYERPDRNSQVWVRWTDRSRPKTGQPRCHHMEHRNLDRLVRDPGTGRLSSKRIRAVERMVRHIHAQLVTGLHDRHTMINRRLTLREGFDIALDPQCGKYVALAGRRWREMLRFKRQLFRRTRTAAPLIDPQLRWTHLRLREIRLLWRTVAHRYAHSGHQDFGLRAAERLVEALYAVASWLRDEQFLPPDAARPSTHWRERLRTEWASITGEHPRIPSRPRYTVDEYRRILSVGDTGDVDPRILLAVALAAECRTGQVLRCTRRALNLPAVDPAGYDTAPPGLLGSLEIPGTMRKPGETVVFTPEQRRAVDQALAGYLANYEAAWRRGAMPDYLLFPGRHRPRLTSPRTWRIASSQPAQPMTRTAALKAYRALEACAGVAHLQGRGWYGLRRVATDLAEQFTADDRVKDRLGGWRRSDTRKYIYQDRLTQALRVKAAVVRREMRLGIAPVTPTTCELAPAESIATLATGWILLDLDRLVAALSPEQRLGLSTRLWGSPASATVTTCVTRTVTNTQTPTAGWRSAYGNAFKNKQLRVCREERATGLEPATSSLGSWHSTN
jgi:hypothetical protein